MLAELPALTKGQAIISGVGINTPVMCRIRSRITKHGGETEWYQRRDERRPADQIVLLLGESKNDGHPYKRGKGHPTKHSVLTSKNAYQIDAKSDQSPNEIRLHLAGLKLTDHPEMQGSILFVRIDSHPSQLEPASNVGEAALKAATETAGRLNTLRARDQTATTIRDAAQKVLRSAFDAPTGEDRGEWLAKQVLAGGADQPIPRRIAVGEALIGRHWDSTTLPPCRCGLAAPHTESPYTKNYAAGASQSRKTLILLTLPRNSSSTSARPSPSSH